jgi:hypothetical protein
MTHLASRKRIEYIQSPVTRVTLRPALCAHAAIDEPI